MNYKKKSIVLIISVIIAASTPLIALGKNIPISNEDSADLPIWSIDDYWTYNMQITYDAAGTTGDIILGDTRFTVTNTEGELYLVEFAGEVTGSVNVAGIIEGDFEDTEITGKLDVRKSDLAIERWFDTRLEGNIVRQLVTNPFFIDLEIKQNVTPVISPFDFPIEAFETWTIPQVTLWLTVEGEVSLVLPYVIAYNFPVYIESRDVTCMGVEVKTVAAGRYNDAFHVKDDYQKYDLWYTPTAANIILAEFDDIRLAYNDTVYWDLNQFSIELIDTSYSLQNNPPYEPSDPSPSNESSDITPSTLLEWSGGDPDEDQVVYDIYFSESSPPLLAMENHSTTSYNPGILEYNTTYFWKIIARDEHGLTTSGPIWTFTTGLYTNSPPNVPLIQGPSSGVAGEPYEYTFTAIDPDGDDLYYWIQWDGGCPSIEWVGPYQSGESFVINNTWSSRGTYLIKAMAKDIYEAESEWGTLQVSMPKNVFARWHSILERIHFIFDYFENWSRFFAILLR